MPPGPPRPPSPAAATMEGRAAEAGAPAPRQPAGARGGCGWVPPPSRRAPSPRAVLGLPGARAHLVLGRRRVSPLVSKTRPEKPPEPRRRHGKLHFGGSSAGRGLPTPWTGGGGRGAPAPARTRGRRLLPASLSVSVTCPRSPPPPPPPSSPRRAGRWVQPRPCVPRGLLPGAAGHTRGCPRGARTQLLGPAPGTRGRERAHAGTRTHADLKSAGGAYAHKGTRTTNTGKGMQGSVSHAPTGGLGRTCTGSETPVT